jgi:glycosyltransferase involved in cell wall biosynthesis
VTARVVVGVPLYNNERHARRALESLLVQTHPAIAFVACDDGSTDATAEIAAEYAALDPRLTVERNERRLGMIGNWRRVFELARERHPEAQYFAWGSDHDVWHPHWARTLATELDAHPEAVLAYPLNQGITDDGETRRDAWRFDTAGETALVPRLDRTWRGMAAGSMVYGLFRADALAAAGVYREVLLPDRLLLSEVALAGEFRQVPAVLWGRRLRAGAVDLNARQRSAFFPGRRVPWYTHLPWYLQHSAVLAWELAIRGARPAGIGRVKGLRLTARYLRIGFAIETPRAWRRLKLRLRRRFLPSLRTVMDAVDFDEERLVKAAEIAERERRAKRQPKPPKQSKQRTAKPAKAAKKRPKVKG